MNALSWLRTPHGDLSLDGGHVTRWSGGGGDVLFVSRESRYAPGEPIRGGVPVIFPWFGDDPEKRGRAAHGFARRRRWSLAGRVDAADATRVTLELTDDERTRELWPHRFLLRLDVVFGDALELALTVENRDRATFTYEDALHTYFTVGDIRRASVRGLEGGAYLDTVGGVRPARQDGNPIAFSGETDRVYHASSASCHIVDPALRRTIDVVKNGAQSTIVWNPWIEKSARLNDLGDDEWPRFVCVEAGNVGADAIALEPGAAHTTRVRISTVPAETE
jgi:glucose-6-phosphate 1-epimerase